MSHNLSSVAVVLCALRVKKLKLKKHEKIIKHLFVQYDDHFGNDKDIFLLTIYLLITAVVVCLCFCLITLVAPWEKSDQG